MARYKLEDVVNVRLKDLKQLPDADLRSLVDRGASLSNRRLKNLHKVGYESPAEWDIGTGFERMISTTKGKSRGELIMQLQAEQRFLQDPLSTVTGMERLIKDVTGDRHYGRARTDLYDPTDPASVSRGEAAYEQGEDITAIGRATTVTKSQVTKIFGALHKLNERKGYGRGSVGSAMALQTITNKMVRTKIKDRNKWTEDALRAFAEQDLDRYDLASEVGVDADYAAQIRATDAGFTFERTGSWGR